MSVTNAALILLRVDGLIARGGRRARLPRASCWTEALQEAVALRSCRRDHDAGERLVDICTGSCFPRGCAIEIAPSSRHRRALRRIEDVGRQLRGSDRAFHGRREGSSSAARSALRGSRVRHDNPHRHALSQMAPLTSICSGLSSSVADRSESDLLRRRSPTSRSCRFFKY